MKNEFTQKTTGSKQATAILEPVIKRNAKNSSIQQMTEIKIHLSKTTESITVLNSPGSPPDHFDCLQETPGHHQ